MSKRVLSLVLVVANGYDELLLESLFVMHMSKEHPRQNIERLVLLLSKRRVVMIHEGWIIGMACQIERTLDRMVWYLCRRQELGERREKESVTDFDGDEKSCLYVVRNT